METNYSENINITIQKWYIVSDGIYTQISNSMEDNGNVLLKVIMKKEARSVNLC